MNDDDDNNWSLAFFCEQQRRQFFDYSSGSSTASYYSSESESTQLFLSNLGLPLLHPFCQNSDGHDHADLGIITPDEFWINHHDYAGAPPPPMGPMEDVMNWYDFVINLHEGSLWKAGLTLIHLYLLPLLALCYLWFILFAPIMATLGCLFLLWVEAKNQVSPFTNSNSNNNKNPLPLLRQPLPLFSIISIITVASSLIMMTDEQYVQADFLVGTTGCGDYGTTLFFLSSIMSFRIVKRFHLRRTFCCLWILWCTWFVLEYKSWDSSRTGTTNSVYQNQQQQQQPLEGFYYDSQNPFANHLVEFWNPKSRQYDHNKATKWMITGDVRTGMPFLLNTLFGENEKPQNKPNWIRVWMPTSDGEEVLALDISFPRKGGHDDSNPIFLLLHGLSGGSDEGYVLDLTRRRNQEGSTVIVMIARGMMDTPLRSWNLFHGARLSDVHDVATTIRNNVLSRRNNHQILVGVGYSMGAIVLNNYVATYGDSCALDGAFSISGGLDCRYQLDDTRSKMVWQPILAQSVKQKFLVFGKHGKKVRERLTNQQVIELMRASSMVELDRLMSTAYYGYESVESFYAEMSALGDVPQEDYFKTYTNNTSSDITASVVDDFGRKHKISNLSIPLCILHALDDPIATWRINAATDGLMRPDRLVQSVGNGNLFLLLTKTGGHVGWPLGWLSYNQQWDFMSGAASEFAEAVKKAKQVVP